MRLKLWIPDTIIIGDGELPPMLITIINFKKNVSKKKQGDFIQITMA